MTALIEARRIWREFGSHIVLEDVSARVNQGEFITIVGASGCGKTTFLRMLLGVDAPTRGQLLMDGAPIPDEPGPDRGIVFQKCSVFPHLDVLDNVMIGLELSGSPMLGKLIGSRRVSARKQACEMLDAVGLSHALHKYPFELSGGMQQRLAIAQSLVKQPRVLLLDEPFGALDPGIRKDMHALILKLWRDTGVTIFMITHDLEEGFYLGTRLWVFDKTRIDPHAPNRFGARITFDIPVGRCQPELLKDIIEQINPPESDPAVLTKEENHV